MKKLLSFLIIFFTLSSYAQQVNLQRSEDSLLAIVASAKTPSAKCDSYMEIAKLYTGQNKDKETEYINKTTFEAEQTRDKKLIAKSYFKISEQWLSLASLAERQANGMAAIEKGLAISKLEQLNEETASLLKNKAYANRVMGKMNEALKYNEEAISYAELTNNDSLKITMQLSYANTLLAKDENFKAFQRYMLALNLAETIDQQKLKMIIYQKIANFYSKIKQIEKSKDYYVKAIDQSKLLKDSAYEIAYLQEMIVLYAENKDFGIAKEYLKILQKRAGKNEDFLQYAASAELSIIYYEDEKNLPEFFKKNPDVFNSMKKYGMLYEYNRTKGIIYTYDKKMDSALYYINLSKKDVNPNNISNTMSWNSTFAFYLSKNNKYLEAAKFLELNIPLAKQIQSLTAEKELYTNLDSMYIKGGDKQKEVSNKLLLFTIKDSLDKQQKANDLLGVEIDLENKRSEREKKLKDEKILKRNNLQYTGIIAAIIALFIALAAMGKLKVKPWLIRALGFLSFILLFEFIILLIDAKLHELTHGEPLPILLVKIVLIAMLLPLHHWLEHKVIHYLVRHEKISELAAK
jgi:hypothetical protein